jgi:flagellar biosynthesis/type III secretory pathway chaperone
VEELINEVYQILQKLTGLHRQMLDAVRLEREALVDVDLKAVQAVTASKQSLIEEIHRTEAARLKVTGELARFWKRPYRELTLPNIILKVQESDSKIAEQLRIVHTTLTILIQRISTQNTDNLAFVEKSLEHIHQMKKNIIEEGTPRSNTYTQRGQKVGVPSTSKLLSKEI